MARLVVDMVVVMWVGRKKWEGEEMGRKEKTWCSSLWGAGN